MLTINWLRKTSIVSGTVTFQVVLQPFQSIVNDWRIQVDGRLALAPNNGIRFLHAEYPRPPTDCTKECVPPPDQIIASFSWDTTFYESGKRKIKAFADGQESSEIELEVDNIPNSYRVLNKKATNSIIESIVPPNVVLQVPEDIAEFIEGLPGRVALLDFELNSTDRFTIPIGDIDTLIGIDPFARVIDVEEYPRETVQETLRITVSEKAAEFLLHEFLDTNPLIQIFTELPSPLEASLITLDMPSIPLDNGKVVHCK